MVAGINRVPTGGSDSPSARVQVANSVNAALAQLATAQTNIATNTASIATLTGALGGDLTGTLPNPTVNTNKVTNTKLAQMAANTIKGNNTGALANASDLTGAQVRAMLGSAVAQVVNFETGAVATGITTIPHDDTIPQNTEGDQYMSLSITPQNASSTLIIDVVLFLSNSVLCFMLATLFQDANANALAAAGADILTAGNRVTISFRHKMLAGTTSSTTFKVRAGGSAAGTTTFDGDGAARKYGGVLASSITITEILP